MVESVKNMTLNTSENKVYGDPTPTRNRFVKNGYAASMGVYDSPVKPKSI